MKLDALKRSLSFIWPNWCLKHVIVIIHSCSKASSHVSVNAMVNFMWEQPRENNFTVFLCFLNWCQLLSIYRCWHFKTQIKFSWCCWLDLGAFFFFFFAIYSFISIKPKWDLLRVCSVQIGLGYSGWCGLGEARVTSAECSAYPHGDFWDTSWEPSFNLDRESAFS